MLLDGVLDLPGLYLPAPPARGPIDFNLARVPYVDGDHGGVASAVAGGIHLPSPSMADGNDWLLSPATPRTRTTIGPKVCEGQCAGHL